ncbi:hypothetical protein EKK70_06730 [Desulfovibrio sp. DS-1]|nr:hypothetical protein EKK70_06730 [Desulfovibrio sp. DS-1]
MLAPGGKKAPPGMFPGGARGMRGRGSAVGFPGGSPGGGCRAVSGCTRRPRAAAPLVVRVSAIR